VRRPSPTASALVVSLTALAAACGDGGGDPRPVAVLSAFPAEMEAVLEKVAVDDVVVADGLVLRAGRAGRTRVLVGMTGIGPVNAAAATRALLDRFDVGGIVFAGVAGSFLRIGDVTVADAWLLREDGSTHPVHAPWLEVAAQVAASGDVAFERCTIVAEVSATEPVCIAHEPAIAVGGTGETEDPFGGRPFQCLPSDDPVFGCDDPPPDARPAGGGRAGASGFGYPFAIDQETAAVAREAAASGVPFIAFRGVSDGAGDPLGLPGFPAQFFAYYRLAAENAAAAAVAFLERLSP
jgi:nucleoside phosphorylase